MSSRNKPIASVLAPVDLRCEGLVNPLGTDALLPRLSWRLEAKERTRANGQVAFQILAASRPEWLDPARADQWKTDRVDDAESLGHPYGGNARPGRRVYWTVRVWDKRGQVSEFAKPSWFEFGLLDPSGGGARWIGGGRELPTDTEAFFADHPAPLLRKTFRLTKSTVERARACFVGLGYGALYVNGHPVVASSLETPWTHFGKRIHYSVHDIAPYLRTGENVVGVVLGNGWYNPLPLKMWGHLNLREHLTVGAPRAFACIEVDQADGARVLLHSDGSWKWSDGPVLRNSVYLGEQTDLRREPIDWMRPGFDDSAWGSARLLPSPGGALEAIPVEPVRVVEQVAVAAWAQPKPGRWIADFGRNLTGRVSVASSGDIPSGTRIRFRHGERLHADGQLNPLTSACGQIKGSRVPPGSERPATAVQEDSVVAAGRALTWAPSFTYHGFRYCEVSGLDNPSKALAVTAQTLRSDVAPGADFECSDPLLEKIFSTTKRTFEANLVSVQSDCPHREKFGYGGDIVATAETGLMLFDLGRFHAKSVRDFADAVRANGGFTETAPHVGISDSGLGNGAGPVEWGTAHPLLLWMLHRWHGDRRLVEEQYPLAVRFFQLIESVAQDGILDNGLGDHETLVPRSTAVTGTAFYQRNAFLMERLARLLGRSGDAAVYRAKAGAIRDAFQRRFVDAATGKVGLGSQACQSVALAWDLVDARPAVLRRLLEAVDAKGGHLETGIFGTMWLLEALSSSGRTDVAHRIVSQRDFPSWGHMLERGATTLWETWKESDNIFSNNHPMFGSVAGWMVRWLAGIQVSEEAVGADRLSLKPQPVNGLGFARAEWPSARGRVVSGWRRDDSGLVFEFVVPHGCTAQVRIPQRDGSRVVEGKVPAEQVPGVTDARAVGGAWEATLAGGEYRIQSVGP